MLTTMQIKKYCVTVILSLLTISLLADSGIYICGHFRRDRTKTVTALKASGLLSALYLMYMWRQMGL